jgi:hypothetical protein
MSETTTETHVNGAAPAAPAAEEPCTDCVSTGEKILAVIAAVFGAFIIVMAIDMATGGKVGGWVAERTRE